MSANDNEHLTTIQAAKMLGLATGTVQKMADAGTLASWKTDGGHRRITTESVNNYLNNKSHVADKDLTINPGSVQIQEKLVLIVDDSHFFSQILRSVVEALVPKTKAVIAHDGFEAVEMFKSLNPQLVLIDIHLPGLDGLSLLNKLFALDRDILKIAIIVTGDTEFSSEQVPHHLSNIPVVFKESLHEDLAATLGSLCSARLQGS